jgi:hypothetical protein
MGHLQAARAEVAEARVECAAKIEATRDHFLREAKALRETPRRAQAELHRMRALIELGNLEHTSRG